MGGHPSAAAAVKNLPKADTQNDIDKQAKALIELAGKPGDGHALPRFTAFRVL